MNRLFTLLTFLTLLCACAGRPDKATKGEKEDLKAKSLLQGIWVDDLTEIPLLHIKGDTIYFLDHSANPVPFKIIGDSLKTYGSKTSRYHILKQSPYTFWIQPSIGETLKLSKSEIIVDSILPTNNHAKAIEEVREVIQKDRIIHYNNIRYRGYAYINPTNIKVIQQDISEEGLDIENVYYDNIIHVCVYQGKNKLFGKDMKKQDFEHLVPKDFYSRSILADMEFIDVNEKGYQYQATLCIPNDVSCYLIHVSISPNGDISYELATNQTN